jgi:hypothetical protein
MESGTDEKKRPAERYAPTREKRDSKRQRQYGTLQVPIQQRNIGTEYPAEGVQVLVIETRRGQKRPNVLACILTLGKSKWCNGSFGHTNCPQDPCQGCGASLISDLPQHLKDSLGQFHHPILSVHSLSTTDPVLTDIKGHQSSVQTVTKTLNENQLQHLYTLLGEPVPRFTICIRSEHMQRILEGTKTDERRSRNLGKSLMK